jgi:hypothetical protein
VSEKLSEIYLDIQILRTYNVLSGGVKWGLTGVQNMSKTLRLWVTKGNGYQGQRVARGLGLYADVSTSAYVTGQTAISATEAAELLDSTPDRVAVITFEYQTVEQKRAVLAAMA